MIMPASLQDFKKSRNRVSFQASQLAVLLACCSAFLPACWHFSGSGIRFFPVPPTNAG
jgi:hypothetical protein